MNTKNITAIILAAGLGTRMKSDIPKVMHPVGSQSILGKVISNLNNAGITDLVVVVGHKAEEIEAEFNGQARFVRQAQLAGSADAVKEAISSLSEQTDTVLVACGDAPLIGCETYERLITRHSRDNAACTLLTFVPKDPASYGRIVRDEHGVIVKIVEEKDLVEKEKALAEVNSGTYCFKKEDLVNLISKIKMNEKKKEFYLTDIIEIFSKQDRRIVSESCCEEDAQGINSRKDLAAIYKTMKKRAIEKMMDSGVTIVDPDTTYIDETAVVGRDTIIFPNTVIEGDVKIGKGCKVGPFARLRPGTVLKDTVEIGNFVEICRTTIETGTRVKHHTYLGDALIGSNVNIGAGTITANYDGKNKHKTIIEDDVFIGVGAVLIAPIKIGKGAKVGAGSVVTKNKDVPSGKTVVGIPAKLFTRGE
ncbi:MAG: sugar phosphate nucleotidyltransferase [Candidatus Omnitrophota bacterium]